MRVTRGYTDKDIVINSDTYRERERRKEKEKKKKKIVNRAPHSRLTESSYDLNFYFSITAFRQ